MQKSTPLLQQPRSIPQTLFIVLQFLTDPCWRLENVQFYMGWSYALN